MKINFDNIIEATKKTGVLGADDLATKENLHKIIESMEERKQQERKDMHNTLDEIKKGGEPSFEPDPKNEGTENNLPDFDNPINLN